MPAVHFGHKIRETIQSGQLVEIIMMSIMQRIHH